MKPAGTHFKNKGRRPATGRPNNLECAPDERRVPKRKPASPHLHAPAPASRGEAERRERRAGERYALTVIPFPVSFPISRTSVVPRPAHDKQEHAESSDAVPFVCVRQSAAPPRVPPPPFTQAPTTAVRKPARLFPPRPPIYYRVSPYLSWGAYFLGIVHLWPCEWP